MAALLMLPVCATGSVAANDDSDAITNDVIARVGDQTITFNEINVALNSSAIVGISVPALGTPERDTARVILLDRFVSANLIYLDALKQGTDRDPAYQQQISRFSNAILAGLYRKRQQAGDIPVSNEEIESYFKQNVITETELTDDIRLQIESTLRRQKLHERLAAAQKTLRDGVDVKVYEENLEIEGEDRRADDAPLANVGSETITWGQLKDRILAAGKGALLADLLADEDEARRNALESEIDLRIMAQKARAAGLDTDPTYTRRMDEFSKTLLTNIHREELIAEIEPSDRDLRAYYQANRNLIMVPEARKLHMVVVETRDVADGLKDSIENGEMTMFVAARDYSIAASAKQDLGEVGWVNQGEMVPMLDELIFSMEPDEIGGPIESPAGWHLLKVLDVRDSRFADFAEDGTRKLVRRKYLQEKLDAYTAELRKNQFEVEVYQDRLVQLAQREADMVKQLADKARQPGSVTHKRIEELNKIIKPPM
jgi:parvulin-like peptidyl-prolyl isomerase